MLMKLTKSSDRGLGSWPLCVPLHLVPRYANLFKYLRVSVSILTADWHLRKEIQILISQQYPTTLQIHHCLSLQCLQVLQLTYKSSSYLTQR